jgi:hypothetical protein
VIAMASMIIVFHARRGGSLCGTEQAQVQDRNEQFRLHLGLSVL